MQKLQKLNVTWNGLLETFTTTVNSWKPPSLKGEIKYRDHLLAALREVVPADVKVEKEYRHNGTTADIWVSWPGLLVTDEVFFELKINLKRKTDFDRLVGQIESLSPGKNKIVVVLIGETDSALLGRLKEKYEDHMTLLGSITMSIIQISPEA